MLVVNVKGSSNASEPEGGFIGYWKEHIHQELPLMCANRNCETVRKGKKVSLKDIEGAHVEPVDNDDLDEMYIIPLCDDCNKIQDGSFEVYDKYLLKLPPEMVQEARGQQTIKPSDMDKFLVKHK